jgi:hypothetical protein
MYYRMRLADPLDTEAGRVVEGLFTADEIEAIRERFYGLECATDLILADPVCGQCDTCSFRNQCRN